MARKDRRLIALPQASPDVVAVLEALAQECLVYHNSWEPRVDFGALPAGREILAAPRLMQTKLAVGLLRFAYDAAKRTLPSKIMTWRNVDKLQLDAFTQLAARLLARRLPWTEPQLVALSALGARAAIDTGGDNLPSLRIATTLKKELSGLEPSAAIRANLDSWCDEILRVPIGAAAKPTYLRLREVIGEEGTSFEEARDRFLSRLSKALDKASEEAFRSVLDDEDEKEDDDEEP